VRCVFALVVVGCSFRPNPSSASLDDAASAADAPTAKHDAPAEVAADASAWPCGAKPASPPTTVVVAPNGATLTMTAIDLSGQGQVALVAPGAATSLSLDMRLVDSRCDQECIDQLEVGWVRSGTGHRSGCAFDNGVPEPNGVHKTISGFTIAAPTMPGAYELRTNIGQNFSCTANGANDWWGGVTPAASTTIVAACVH
jgi:hypothetical protein